MSLKYAVTYGQMVAMITYIRSLLMGLTMEIKTSGIRQSSKWKVCSSVCSLFSL